MDNKTKKISFFEFLPPKLRVVFNISLMMNEKYFLEYQEAMHPNMISGIEEIEKRLFVYLPMALMYNNEKMTTFIYNIIEKSGYNIDETEFKTEYKDKMAFTEVKDEQLGGGKTKDYLYGIGMIIFAIFYDYYIITNGSWDILRSSFDKINDISEKIKTGCPMEYVPSSTISLLAHGTTNPSFIYTLEYAMQCLSTPTLLSANLQKLEEEKDGITLLSEMQNKLKDLPGFPQPNESESQLVLFEKKPEEEELESQLVPFGENPDKIKDFLSERLLVLNTDETDEYGNYKIRLSETIHKYKSLADMSPDEFKKVFEFQEKKSVPTILPTQAPTFQHTISIASDIIGAFKELAPATFTFRPSFSFQNVFLWTLQDTIRETVRKIEDNKIKTTREIEDLITNATRVFSDLSSLPYIISFLFFLNFNAMRSFISFAKKIIGKKPKSVLEIEDYKKVEELKELEELEGGYIRRKNKRKTRKHKRSGKRRQTRRKKGRRVTRKR